jgi:hypothetical protein
MFPVPDAARARHQIAAMLSSSPVRTTALAATISALCAAWALPTIDAATVALYDVATARGTGDVVCLAGNPAVTSVRAAWTAADVGKQITIPGAGTAGAHHVARIATVVGPTSATISPAPVTAGTFLAVWGRPIPLPYTNPDTSVRGAVLLASAVDPRQFLATGDGVTDDTAAMQAALRSGSPVRIPAGCTFKVTGLTMGDECPALLGDGPTSIIKVTADAPAVTVNSTGRTIAGITFQGTGKSAGLLAQAGVSLAGTVSDLACRVADCYFRDLAGRGIYAAGTVDVGHMEGSQISGCHFLSCWYGYESGDHGEYITLSGCTAWDCRAGFVIAGGNNLLTGCKASNGYIGIRLENGPNDSHGLATNCQFNHNTYPIDVDSTQYGFVFDGCAVFEGTVQLRTCSGIVYRNGFLDATAYIFFIATGIVIENNIMPGTYANAPTVDANYRASRVQWRNNRSLTGTIWPVDWAAQVEGGYAKAKTAAAGQTVANGANAAIVLAGAAFDNWTAWNDAYTGDTFYNNATGEFTVKGYGRGAIKCDLQIKFTGAGTLSLAYLEIRVDGVVKGYVPQHIAGGNFFRFNGEIRANAGQKITFHLYNSTGNTVTIPDTTDTFIALEGL